MGVIESLRSVTVQRDSKGGGLIAGAVVGGVAGSGVGDGRGSTIASVLGAVGGAIAGQMIEERGNQRPGHEITLRLDSGERRVIVQELDNALQVGARVRIVGSGSAVRVAPQ
jgi:outer membrane lipoprotein SlyB